MDLLTQRALRPSDGTGSTAGARTSHPAQKGAIMAVYTVVLTRMMSQVHNVEASDLKSAVAQALDQETLQPDSGNNFDAAGDAEVQCVELDRVEVWSADTGDESDIF